MMTSELRRLSLLLCLLWACTPTHEPMSAREGELIKTRGSTASRTAPLLVPPAWDATGTLEQQRSGHTATLLPNGKVLVVGGRITWPPVPKLNSAELYDPLTGSWSSTGSLRYARLGHTATLLPNGGVLVVGGWKDDYSALDSAELYDMATGTWSPAPCMAEARSDHIAVLTQGKVLVVAGNQGQKMLASAEAYDPVAGVWSPVGSLAQAREQHTATLLPGGKVLVVGGGREDHPLVSSEVYDPGTGAWSSAGSMVQARRRHTTTLLTNGKVLVVGGQGQGRFSLSSVEEYDTTTGTWSSASSGSLADERDRHSAVLMPDGKLLVMGGIKHLHWSPDERVSSTELYDPSTKAWSFAGHLKWPRSDLTATLLPGGQVLVAGGQGQEYMAEVYRPVSGAWSSAKPLPDGSRWHHTATLLPDGKLLVVGCSEWYSYCFTADVYDPASGTWSSTLPSSTGAFFHTATLLLNGRVLVAGGIIQDEALSSATVYDPATRIWSYVGSLQQGRYSHTATLLANGRVLVTGGASRAAVQAEALSSAEVYEPATRTWSPTGPLQQARACHTDALLPDGKVIVMGGSGSNGVPLSSAEVYDPISGQWAPTRSMKREHAFHTATQLPDGKVLIVGGNDRTQTPSAYTETYDPSTRSWSTDAPLNYARAYHTTTQLPGGRILVVGGTGDSAFPSPPPEVYDPVTQHWSVISSPIQARYSHTASMLPGGKVLVVGGIGAYSSALSSAELYMDSAWDETELPRLIGVSPTSLECGDSMTVTGEHFQDSSEANGGNTQSSATNYSLLSLNSVETGQWFPLPWHDFSDTSVSALLPCVPNGHYLLHVTSRGRTASQVVSIINTHPPNTLLELPLPPAVTQSTSATFSFSSVLNSSFECNLDGIASSRCTSPQHYSDLPEGPHTFRVRALDPAGVVDPSPAECHWVVDRTKPVTKIGMAPPALTHLPSARFSFSSEEESSFECSLDRGAFTACSVPQDYTALVNGPHLFQVRAIDRVGNIEDLLPERAYSWTVDTQPPTSPAIERPTPDQQLFTSQPLISGLAEPYSTVKLTVDGATLDGQATADDNGYWELPAAPFKWGSHLVTATATDPAGNTSTPSRELSFSTVRRGYYGCAAGPSSVLSWPWVLLFLLRVRRGRGR